MAARHIRNVPVRLIASTRSHSSIECSWEWAVRRIPATLATTWSAPKASTAAATVASATAGSLTSPTLVTTPGGASKSRTSRASTWAPSSASRSTVALPIPDAAPVTRATLRSKRCTARN